MHVARFDGAVLLQIRLGPGKFYKGRSQEKHVPCGIPHRNRNALLVYIHPDIFNIASHKGRSSSGAVELKHSNPTPQGAPFILRRESLTKSARDKSFFLGCWPPRDTPVA
jgi:hypothetical protein